jgi:16S rRNA (cytosine1402-N4)-methyltransferase
MTRKKSDYFHEPVLAAEVVELLVTDPNGVYLDLTVGGGGHLMRLAQFLGDGARLYGVDKDPEAVVQGTRVLTGIGQFRKIYHASFGDILHTAELINEKWFDGIMLDLGISSRQIDEPSRGFSFQQDGPLDMRFDPAAGSTAADLVNTLSERELADIFREYGEERQATGIARAIVRERQRELIRTTQQLATIVRNTVRPPHQVKSLARVFQSLRIAVNKELDELKQVLPAAVSLLRSGGRLAVISYHSLEDRIVKRFFQENSRSERLPEYVVAPEPTETKPPLLKLITRKPVTPDDREVRENPRARSARLRVAERN